MSVTYFVVVYFDRDADGVLKSLNQPGASH